MFWAVPAVDDDPCIYLAGWAVVETELGERHLVGCNIANGLGRVSSAIEQFDAREMRFTTRSGRLYRVAKGGGTSREAWYAWEAWASFNAVKAWREVTDQYGSSMRAHPAGDSTIH